jgi:predicted nuclease of predicted toxin-antitoxin system
MTKFLLDANLSPKTAQFLSQTFGLDAVSLVTLGQGGLADADVIALAEAEDRVIITLDLDFGELYHQRAAGEIGVMILRLRDETRTAVEAALARFFRTVAVTIDLDRTLVIIEETRIRVVRPRQEEQD